MKKAFSPIIQMTLRMWEFRRVLENGIYSVEVAILTRLDIRNVGGYFQLMKFIALVVLVIVGVIFFKMESDEQAVAPVSETPVPPVPVTPVSVVQPVATPAPDRQPDASPYMNPPADHVSHLTTDDATKPIPESP
jgi:hypothetical protein